MAVASGWDGQAFGPTTFSQTKLPHAYLEYKWSHKAEPSQKTAAHHRTKFH